MPIPMSTQFDQKDPRYGKGPSQRTPLLNRREVSDIPVASWSTRCSGIFEMLARLKGYSLLEDKERLATSASHSTHHSITFQVSSVKWPRLLSILIVLLALSLTGGVGFFVGKKSTGDVKNPLDVELFGGVPRIRHTFQYNRTFAQAPSEVTDKAWAEIFPHQGGFFRHPMMAPDRSAFSVYHQLHCLNGFRHQYWSLYFALENSHNLSSEELAEGASHVRHCIDFLRQSLMCLADTTIEPVEQSEHLKAEVKGVRGFGVEHTCRDWKRLKDWVSNWEVYGQNLHGKTRDVDSKQIADLVGE